ncbi:alpha/beta-hydrolase family protein [Nocardia sp. CWNU-33]|uniref:alpha/beta-hydrolase family protein n=1 Tax=Nocardia sp. CWNU-33 TaxID=3392117 RepID=UPI00398EDDF5
MSGGCPAAWCSSRCRDPALQRCAVQKHFFSAANSAFSGPKLLVYGESLGSQDSEGAFTGLADIRAKAEGMLPSASVSSSKHTTWADLDPSCAGPAQVSAVRRRT